MRICITTHNFPLTEKDSRDAGVFVKDFAYELQKKGNDVFVFVPDINGKKGCFKDIKVEWFTWLGGKKKLGDLSLKNPIDLIMFLSLFFSGPIKLEEFIRKNDIDELISMWAIPSGYFAYRASKKTGIKYSVWALGSDINKYSRFPVLGGVIKKVLINSRFLFANGTVLADKIEKISRKKCEVLSTARILPSETIEVQVDKTKKNFLFVGRLEKVKGIDILIEAMVEVFKKNQNCVLYILGDGSLKERIHEFVLKNNFADKIILKGNVSSLEVASFLKVCDCVILPSRSESAPLVIGEAVQFRTPLIVSNVGDMENIIKKYKIGRVFTSLDRKALTAEILDFISGEVKIGDVNFDLAKKYFNINNSVDRFNRMIQMNNNA